MKKRDLGAMRHRLLIKNIVRSPDGGGGYTRADVDGDVIMGSVSPMSMGEQRHYSQLQRRVTHKVIIRRHADVKQGVTIIWQRDASLGGDLPLYVEIESDPRPDRPSEWLELKCREGGNL